MGKREVKTLELTYLLTSSGKSPEKCSAVAGVIHLFVSEPAWDPASSPWKPLCGHEAAELYEALLGIY